MESIGTGTAIKWQGVNCAAVVPSDTEITPAALYVGTGGDVVIVDLRGVETTFTNVQDGTFMPIVVKKVLAISTASNIVALW